MVATDYHSHSYVVRLNAWHLHLASCRDLIEHMLDVAEGPEWLQNSASIAVARLSQLIEDLPFPAESDL